MKAWIALLMMIPACGGGSDKATDANVDGPPQAQTCFGSFVTVCFTTPGDVPAKPVMLTADLAIDTAASAMCDQHNDQVAKYCVIAGTSLTLAAAKTIRATGTKPLVLLSTSTMAIQGIVDVSSNRMAGPLATGAGANPATCTNGTPAAQNGGGYGGSFGGKGGDGERLVGAPPTSGTSAAALAAPPPLLRGGCPGGNGDNAGGAGGSGGGAVALIAMTSIQLDGKINASGAGGHGGLATKSGGGGGGSGGLIVLDAPSIMTMPTGLLFANGGGGGQGGTGGGTAVIGDDGGESAAPATQAVGGNNVNTAGGSGGPGSAGTNKLVGSNGGGNTPAGVNGGGGGGGGAAGFIRAHGITTNIAPPSFVP